MKFQFPLTIGVFVAGFSAFGCGVSNAEIPSPDFWKDAAVDESDAAVGPDSSTAADSGSEDGSIYGNDASAAGAGGDHHQAGSGGAGGDDEPVAGSGGAGGDDEPEAGSGGMGGVEAPVGGSGGAGGEGNTCPTEYSIATHITIDVTWPEKKEFGLTIVAAGSGKVHIWTKSNIVEDGDTADVLSRSCGSVLPPVNLASAGTTFTGVKKLLPEILPATWEAETMPTFPGTMTKVGDIVTMNPGPALVGLQMDNPTGAWPAASAIKGVDHDGDGFLGLTAVPKTTDGYSTVPVATNKTDRADRIYLAIRNIMTLSATVEGCPETFTGTADVQKFDNHVIGCRLAKTGSPACNSTQRDFVDKNTTVYTVKSATFTSQRIAANASCMNVRDALP